MMFYDDYVRRAKPEEAPRQGRQCRPALVPTALPGSLGSTGVHDSEMTNGDPERTLDDVTREFPDWHCYAPGINGYVFARLRGSFPLVIVRGKDPMALRNEIRRWTDDR
jgi:hypothetical protein